MAFWAVVDITLSGQGYEGGALVQVGYLALGVVAAIVVSTFTIRSLNDPTDADQRGFRSGLQAAIGIGTSLWVGLAVLGLIGTLLVGACIAILEATTGSAAGP